MANPDGTPSGGMDHWTIAGFGDNDHWNTVEGEDSDSGPPSPGDIDWITEVTVHIVDGDGVDWYWTLYGPWDDWDEFAEEIDDMYGDYAGEMA